MSDVQRHRLVQRLLNRRGCEEERGTEAGGERSDVLSTWSKPASLPQLQTQFENLNSFQLSFWDDNNNKKNIKIGSKIGCLL